MEKQAAYCCCVLEIVLDWTCIYLKGEIVLLSGLKLIFLPVAKTQHIVAEK